MKMLRITLKRSFIGRNEKHRRILRALGLRKINHSVVQKDTPSITGMIHKISHMVEVINVEGETAKSKK